MKTCYECDETELPNEIESCPECGGKLYEESKFAEIKYFTLKEIKELFADNNKRFIITLVIFNIAYIILTWWVRENTSIRFFYNFYSSDSDTIFYYLGYPDWWRDYFPLVNISTFISIILAFIIIFHFVYNDKEEKNYLTKKSFLFISFVVYIIINILNFSWFINTFFVSSFMDFIGNFTESIFENIFSSRFLIFVCFTVFIYIIFYKKNNGKIYLFLKKHDLIFICLIKISTYFIIALTTCIKYSFNFNNYFDRIYEDLAKITNPLSSIIIDYLFFNYVDIRGIELNSFLVVIISLITDIIFTVLFIIILKKLMLRNKQKVNNREDAKIL